MKIYEAYNSYGTDDFEENKKWSCHSWLFKCIENIDESISIVERNAPYINERDLVGKYNALNYLLDVYSYHQSSKFRNYPQEQNPELDFTIILYALLENGADVDSVDYERKSFLSNLKNAFSSQESLTWKQKYRFLSQHSLDLCNLENRKLIVKFLLNNEKRPNYLGLNLDFTLSINNANTKIIKL